MKDKTGNTLDIERFRTIVDAYGADPSKWPEAEREAALLLLASSSEAVAIVDQAAQLDRVLNQAPMVQPSPELERIVSSIPERSLSMPTRPGLDERRTVFPFATLWKSAVAATFAVILGFITGAATVEPLDMSNSSTDWEDFTSLAFVPDLDQELSP
jgi:hypothetical protein